MMILYTPFLITTYTFGNACSNMSIYCAHDFMLTFMLTTLVNLSVMVGNV